MIGVGAEARLVPAGTAGSRSYLAALLLALADLTADPLVVEALQEVEFEDDAQGGGVRIGRAAFQLLATVLAENIAAPDFELAPTRDILEVALASRLQGAPESAARLATLLDLLELLVQPDSVVFENMQDIMSCLDEHDDGAAIPGMLYDWLTVEELAVEDFARDLQQTGAQPAMESLRLVAAGALFDLADNPGLITDLARVGARFLEPERAPAVIDLAFDAHARGVLEEVLRALGALGRCEVLRAADDADTADGAEP